MQLLRSRTPIFDLFFERRKPLRSSYLCLRSRFRNVRQCLLCSRTQGNTFYAVEPTQPDAKAWLRFQGSNVLDFDVFVVIQPGSHSSFICWRNGMFVRTYVQLLSSALCVLKHTTYQLVYSYIQQWLSNNRVFLSECFRLVFTLRSCFFYFFFNPADPRGITQGGLPGFPTQLDIFRRWCQGLIRSQVPCTPSLHCLIANSASTQSQQPVKGG